MLDRVVLVCLAVWALITGLLVVTNIKIEWGPTIAGYAAFVLGIVCLMRVFSGKPPPG